MANSKRKVVKSKNSTLAIDAETSDKLEIFCRKYDITKKDFVSISLSYFERTGVDIYSNDITTDIQTINEKIDSIIKLQADASIKLTGLQQSANILTYVKEDTTKLIEQTEQKTTLFGRWRKRMK